MVSCLKNPTQHVNNVLPLISPSYSPFNYSLVKRAVIILKHKMLKHELTWYPVGRSYPHCDPSLNYEMFHACLSWGMENDLKYNIK